MQRKFLLVSMGGQAEGCACADPGARTPIGASGNNTLFLHVCNLVLLLNGPSSLHALCPLLIAFLDVKHL